MKNIKIEFVLKGKEFDLPKMTVALHEEAMGALVEFGKLPEEKYNRLFNKTLILTSLHKIDPSVKLEDISGMHPDDYLELFAQVWQSGRKSDKGFRAKRA